jgi:hypothetical protein
MDVSPKGQPANRRLAVLRWRTVPELQVFGLRFAVAGPDSPVKSGQKLPS